MDLEWDQTLSTGIQQIDDQHKELIQRINDLRDAVSRGRGKAEIGRTLQFLEAYVAEHFGTEERLMLERKYAGYDLHKQEHDAFVRELQELKRTFASMESRHAITALLTVRIQRKLVDWFVSHIGQVDKSLGAYLTK